jgi:hypothetical protein
VTEHGYEVRPRSTADIVLAAEQFLRRHAPEHLSSGHPVDLAGLVDHELERDRIVVYPVSPDELPGAEAETRAGEGGWIEIWLRTESFEALFELNSNTNRARSTISHEIGHAVLHAEDVRTGRHRPQVLALRRAPRSQIPPYRDCEWQAHTFAGALLMPRPALRNADLRDSFALADRFQVSEAFARSHLKRIQRVL